MAMSKERRNEIAYCVLKHKLTDGGHGNDGIELTNGFRRHVGNVAKITGVPFGEMLEFSVALAQEILTDVSDPRKAPTEDELLGYHAH